MSELKILVVDDREDNLLSIEAILENSHYKIVKAHSGRAALKILLREHDFSLILMDVQMPDLSGLETASLIYESEKLRNIPIIFITAHQYGDEQIFHGYKMGAVDYIYKPFNPALLRAKVAVFTELQRKNQELLIKEKLLMEANQQLIENNNSLKEINEDLDRYAFVASHDLQEPLRKIMLFSDKILRQQNLSEETLLNINKIVASSSRMKLLIDDLLQFSRHSTHLHEFQPIELGKTMQEVMIEMEREIEHTEASISIEQLPDIKGIPILIHQLFFNLLGNAVKYRRADIKPEIEITNTGTIQNGRPYHKISIRDNGVGFDPKYAEDIFTVFKRLHSYSEVNGNGIGLSICKKIVDHHNGMIKAESTLNEGSVFHVFLPEV